MSSAPTRLLRQHHSTSKMTRALFLGILCAGASVGVAIASCDVSLSDFGAYADGVNYDDDALNAALQKCSGGGRIVFPAGKYLLSPFNLTSNLELYLEADSTLLASTDFSRWPIVPPFPSYPDTKDRVAAFIGGVNIENSSIRGFGTIDGQGSAWWDAEGLQYGRPRLIEPMYCKNFTMTGVTVLDPPFWAMHPYACDTLLFEDITYSAPPNSPNTDGIDPDSCSNVIIRNFSTLHCGDDAIAIKSGKDAQGRAFGMPSYNILIEGGFVGPSSGIDIGSEMSGDVYNVTVRNVHFKEALFAVRIKSGRGRGGKVSNCTFEDLTLEHNVMGLAISMLYAEGEPAPPASETTPHIENLQYTRISGTAGTAGAFLCLPESQCRGLALTDVNITSFLGGFECFRAQGSTSGVVIPDACF